MAWLDDRIRDHPKIRKASPVAFQWWAFALAYCSAHGTGGYLDDAIEIMRVPKRVVNELVKVCLWDREEDGLWVHDWQEHNEKRDSKIDEKRAQARERQRRHRERVRSSRPSVTRDEAVTVTRDKERDSSRGRTRARAGPRPNDHDHDHEEAKPEAVAVDVTTHTSTDDPDWQPPDEPPQPAETNGLGSVQELVALTAAALRSP